MVIIMEIFTEEKSVEKSSLLLIEYFCYALINCGITFDYLAGVKVKINYYL